MTPAATSRARSASVPRPLACTSTDGPSRSTRIARKNARAIRYTFSWLSLRGVASASGRLELFASQIDEVPDRPGGRFARDAVGAGPLGTERDLIGVIDPEDPLVNALDQGQDGG